MSMLAPLGTFLGARWPSMGHAGGGALPDTVGAGLGFVLPTTVAAGLSGRNEAGGAGAVAAERGGCAGVFGAVATGITVRGAPAPKLAAAGRQSCVFFLSPCMGGGGMQVETSGDAMTTMPLEHDEQPAVLRSVTAPVPASSVGSRAEASTPATSYTVVRERLTEAVLNGGTVDLQSAIDGALRAGMTGQEVRRARDAMAAIESADTRKRVELGVDEAIESDDWWKLQASMQAVVGAGFGDSDLVVNLREAMRTHRRRREVLREISRAAGARDAHALRTAIEAALLTHAQEADVRRAR